jgi:hypothetical protein
LNKPLNRDAGWKLDPKDDQKIRFWTGKYWTDCCEDAGSDAELYAAAELGEQVVLPDRPHPSASPSSRSGTSSTLPRKPVDRSPGWKPDPKDPSRLRYWKGGYWTQLYAQPNPDGEPTPIQVSSGSSGLVEIGYLTSVLLPIVGAIIGIVLLTKSEDEHGTRVLIASIVCGIAWFVLFSVL